MTRLDVALACACLWGMLVLLILWGEHCQRVAPDDLAHALYLGGLACAWAVLSVCVKRMTER